MSGDLTPQLLTLSLLLLHVNQQAEESQSRKTNNSQTRKDRNSNNKKREKRKCCFCGILGHLEGDCRKKKRRMSATCFQCRETGHWARDCPRKKETKAESSQGKKEGLQLKKTDFKKGGKDNKSQEKRKCKFCGKVGHLVKDCRKKKAKMNDG